MRKIFATEFVTLDGVLQDPHEWSFQFWNEEAQQYKFDELFASDALLLGRVTYELFAKSWPSLTDETNKRRVEAAGGKTKDAEGNPFADRMNSIRKYVVSTTLKEPKWTNSIVIEGNLTEELAKLKRHPGQDIAIHGSGTLVLSLLKQDLLDELRLMVFPIVLGKGWRLFQDSARKNLKLIDTKTFSTGVVVLTYAPEKGN